MNIPIFKLDFDKEFVDEFKKRTDDILTSGRPIGENKYVNLFESEFANLQGVKYAVSLSSGTAAIETALKIVGVKNKYVITPANTFFATTVAVENAGGKVKLIDIEEENFSINPDLLEEELKSHKDEIGAVIIVHVGGIISKNIERIVKICLKHNVPLVEDAAQAHLSKYKDFTAGAIGEIGCFSFFPTKVMTAGEAGMLTTNKQEYADLAKSLKNFGRDNEDIEKCINPQGNNYKISEFTGLLGYLDCKRVNNRVEVRNKYKDIYVKRLKNSGYSPILQEEGTSSYYKMILRTEIDREWLRDFCKKNNITLTGEVWKTPIHKQPLYKEKYKDKKFPVTDKASKTHICPPLYPELTEAEVNYICDILLQAEKEYEK